MMSEPLDQDTFVGPHPTNGQFVDKLAVWGFTHRKTDGVHLVFRAPGGGTLRVLRSLLGRADAGVVDKAARLVGVTVDQFWAGPVPFGATVVHTDTEPAVDPSSAAAQTARPPARTARRHVPPARDRIISMVLAAHTRLDRPMGFDQVVELCHGRVTREQVGNASARLCQDGDLDRIRSGVYQWSGGVRAIVPAGPAVDLRALRHSQVTHLPVTNSAPPLAQQPVTRSATVELFERLFPGGVRMNAEMLADFEELAHLTEKLARHTNAS